MNLDPKVIKTSSDKFIYIYDNAFSFFEQTNFYRFVTNSLYSSDGHDGPYKINNNQFYSKFNNNDVVNMGFIKTNSYVILNKRYQLDQRKIKQVRVNLSNFFEKSFAHTDKKGLTLIYYANLKWDIFWGGHTLFLSEDLTEIDYTCVYKPNRVILFDGIIPHSISPISTMCSEHRYSFVIQFGEIENDDRI